MILWCNSSMACSTFSRHDLYMCSTPVWHLCLAQLFCERPPRHHGSVEPGTKFLSLRQAKKNWYDFTVSRPAPEFRSWTHAQNNFNTSGTFDLPVAKKEREERNKKPVSKHTTFSCKGTLERYREKYSCSLHGDRFRDNMRLCRFEILARVGSPRIFVGSHWNR